MSRPPRGDRLTARVRPKRRAAAKANIFKYQLAFDPSRVEENDLKRALQESLEEQMSSDKSSNGIKPPKPKKARTDRRQQQKTASSSPEVTIIETIPATPGKRTRLSAGTSNGHHQSNNKNTNTNNKCDANLNSLITLDSPPSLLLKTPDSANRPIRTYSRSQKSNNIDPQQTTPNTNNKDDNKNNNSSQASPHNCLKSSFSSLTSTAILCKPNKCQRYPQAWISKTSVNVIHKRNPEGSWSLLGVPEEKVLYIRDDEPPRRLICYPAIKHVEGDVIQVRDSVLLRSGGRKTDLPYIAKVCAFWEDAETGGVMMSLFWYYRPEHTEDGRRPHHLVDEIFASRHRDVDSVECIEDKCYVLTFNEYCRYKKKCKMEQVNTTWSLTDVTIPMSNESYPRRNRIPDSDVNPELVFCCRQVYDSRMKRLLKNPLINTKYGHI